MNNRFLFLPLILATLFISTCSQTNEPKPPEYKDPRMMIWSVDTLAYPGSAQTNMCSVWGSSPNDVWTCGHNSMGRGKIWHFNGTTWNEVNLFEDIEQGALSPRWVWGIDENNVWIVGSDDIRWPNRTNGLIIYYNGTHWIKYSVDEGQPTYDVWGDASNDIWTCGNKGVIYHYNGGFLTLYDSLKIDYPENGNYVLWSIKKYNNELFVMAGASGEHSSNQISYFLKQSASEWIVIDSFYVNDRNYKFGSYKTHISQDNNLYSYGLGGLYLWQEERWDNLFSELSYVQGCWVINENYKIVVGGRGEAYFFDGSSWVRLTSVGTEDVFLTAVWTDGYEVFIIGYTLTGWPSKTIVWRGK